MKKCLRRSLVISFLLIISGFSLLWFGLRPVSLPVVSHSPVALPPPVATGSATQGVVGERVLITEVVDGDTIKSYDKTVRLIGIDTPETVDPRRPVGCFGKEASNETKSLLTNKIVILQKDVSETDKYKRLLRLVYLPLEEGLPAGRQGQILFVNDYLVRQGFAKVYTYPPDVKFNEQFRQAEKEAREEKRGLWGRCL